MDRKTTYHVVESTLGTPAAMVLAKATQAHFRLWKYQRWSDTGTLATMRRILCDAGFARLLRNPEWTINRGEREYQNVFGASLGQEARSNELTERLGGVSDPYEDEIWLDSGPGNGTALYEAATPGWIAMGLGNELLYSIDGTLRNALRPTVQGNTNRQMPAYAAKIFKSASQSLEMLSAVEFATSGAHSLRPRLDEIFGTWETLTSPASATRLESLTEQARQLTKNLAALADQKRLATGITLGFVLDELESHRNLPNGMNFAAALLANALAAAPKALKAAKPVAASAGLSIADLTTRLKTLSQFVATRFAQPLTERTKLNDAQLAEAESVGDALRALAFAALHKMDESPRQLLFTCANELWRLSFFERDASRWSQPTAERAVWSADHLIQWLRRPWGILRQPEMEAACRGIFGPEKYEEQPKALFFFAGFLRYEPEAALTDIFGSTVSPEQSMQALNTLATRRISLATVRREVSHVAVDDPEAIQALDSAHTVINALVKWVYEQPGQTLLDEIQSKPHRLRDLLEQGAWLEAQSKEGYPGMTRRQSTALATYAADPVTFVQTHFDFAEIEENPWTILDFYPPELFELIHT